MEKNRHTPQNRTKSSKLDKVLIVDSLQKVAVDRVLLPPDTVFKGYEPVAML